MSVETALYKKPIAIRLVPPVSSVRFWIVQLLTVTAFVIHQIFDGHLGMSPFSDMPRPATLALFLVPILYGGLNFGVAGGAATAATSIVLTLLDVADDTSPFSTPDSITVLLELALFIAVGLTVGYRVELEHNARSAEQRAVELFRQLYERDPNPIFFLTKDGAIEDANPAAESLFNINGARPAHLSGLVGDKVCKELLAGNDSDTFEAETTKGKRYFKALCSTALDTDGQEAVQVTLSDITADKLRHRATAHYAAHVLKGQEEERRRISQELHDSPVQMLVHLCRTLDAAHEKAVVPETKASVEEARKIAEDSIKSLRDIARGLRPPALDDLGLAACVRRLAGDTNERLGIPVDVTLHGSERRLRHESELALFRITQEALSNVERHADANKVEVKLSFGRNTTSVIVKDSGRGFDSNTVQSISSLTSLGIIGMRERAELVGGELQIHSVPGTGTTVVAYVPE